MSKRSLSHAKGPLSAASLARFQRDGFVLLRGFYDLEREIRPLQRAIHAILGLLLDRHGPQPSRRPFTATQFDDGYRELVAIDRRLGGFVYDAVKQLPEFVRLVAATKNVAAYRQARDTDLPGIAGGGSGTRIDNPGEQRFMAPWHQEYPAQFRSMDGAVFWSPLRTVTPELGPVEVCARSHRDGLVRVLPSDPANPDRSGAYALRLEDEAARVARYRRAAPLTKPGDLLIMDFLTIHRSGENRSALPRWSMQFRYFNFREPTGLKLGWPGSFAAGTSIGDVHPELLAPAQR